MRKGPKTTDTSHTTVMLLVVKTHLSKLTELQIFKKTNAFYLLYVKQTSIKFILKERNGIPVVAQRVTN